MEVSEARSTLHQLFPELDLGEPLGGSSGGRSVFQGCHRGRKVIAKLHPQPGKAEQESNALALAKRLLEAVGLGVPSLIATNQQGILIESVEGSVPDMAGNDRHLRLCIEYLAKMARAELPTQIPNHYFGAPLRHRLRQERGFFEATESQHAGVSDLRADFENIWEAMEGEEVPSDRLQHGLAITCIIRTGANLRQLSCGSSCTPDAIEKARQTIRLYDIKS